MPVPLLSEETRKAILEMYRDQGIGSTAIAKTLGIGSTSVFRVLKRAGIKPNRFTLKPGRAGWSRFSDDISREIAAKYSVGASLQALAEEYGCTNGPIRRAVQRFGDGLRRRGNKVRAFTDDQIAEMKRLWHSGVSQTAIGEIMEADQGVISNALRLHGIEPTVRRRQTGSRHGSWRGGITVVHGYVFERIPRNSPFASMQNTGGYALQHRLVVARSLGRPLLPTETVHHINGDRADNRLSNLELRQGKHGKHIVFCCADCGSRNVVPITLAHPDKLTL